MYYSADVSSPLFSSHGTNKRLGNWHSKTVFVIFIVCFSKWTTLALPHSLTTTSNDLNGALNTTSSSVHLRNLERDGGASHKNTDITQTDQIQSKARKLHNIPRPKDDLSSVNSDYIKDIFSAMLLQDREKETWVSDQWQEDMPTVHSFTRKTASKRNHSVLKLNISDLGPITDVSRLELVVEHSPVVDTVHNVRLSPLTVVLKKASVEVIPTALDDYLIFDITGLADAVTRMILSGTPEPLKFRLKEKQRGDHPPYFRPGISNSSIVIYEHIVDNPLIEQLEPGRRVRREVTHGSQEGGEEEEEEGEEGATEIHDLIQHMSNGTDGAPNQYRPEHCRRYSWTIDMSILPWEHWYLAPRYYDAGYCKGICSFPFSKFMNFTSHSFIKSNFHYQTFFMNSRVPRAACVPVKLSPQTILYKRSEYDLVSVQYPNMRVASCGCL